MPSAFKSRRGKPSFAEMRKDVDALRKPVAGRLEAVFNKYHQLCLGLNKKEIQVCEPEINWKALLMSLPPPQSSQIIGVGVRKILLKETECVYEGVFRFHVERLDGSQVSFEWRDAYDDPYHNFRDKSFKDDVETALRAAILPHLVMYKEMLSKDSQIELVSHISGVALPWSRAVVQHFPVTFEILVDAFLNENQLKIEQVKLEFCENHAYRIKDPILLDKWRLFHRSQANYRIIAADEAMDQSHL